jgi:hypothetical protein
MYRRSSIVDCRMAGAEPTVQREWEKARLILAAALR